MQNLRALQASNRRCRHEQQQSLATALPSHNERFVDLTTHATGCSEADAVAVVLLVPVRAAMHGSFPLAGTYFQACVLQPCVRVLQMHAHSTRTPIRALYVTCCKMSNILI
jgi:hypothetical protein